jgi:cyclase
MRTIARLDIKNDYVIKGINFEGLRKIGKLLDLSYKYYNDGLDELLLIDSVATLYSRNNLFDVIKKITEKIFIPVCVGGGIRSLNDIEMALNSGADKVAINSAIVKDISLLKFAKKNFGASNLVVSIEVKKNLNEWEIYVNNGRDKTGKNLSNWVKQIQEVGCGEILITSIDSDGTKKGLNYDLLEYIKSLEISVPLIISGGVGNISHVSDFMKIFPDEALAIGSALHYKLIEINEIKKLCAK